MTSPVSPATILTLQNHLMEGRITEALVVLGSLRKIAMCEALYELTGFYFSKLTKKELMIKARYFYEANTPEKRAEAARREKIECARITAFNVVENALANALELLGAPIEATLTDDQFRNPHTPENKGAVQAAWRQMVAKAVAAMDLTDEKSRLVYNRAVDLGFLEK